MILLALASILLEGTVSVPHSHWRAIDVPVTQAGTEIRCTFEVPEQAAMMQAMLVTLHDAERFSQGRSFSTLASTGFDRDATLHYRAEQPGKYVLVLDNRIEGRRPTEVKLKVELVAPELRDVRTLPPERRHMVVLVSLLFFLGVVAYSARKLMA